MYLCQVHYKKVPLAPEGCILRPHQKLEARSDKTRAELVISKFDILIFLHKKQFSSILVSENYRTDEPMSISLRIPSVIVSFANFTYLAHANRSDEL